MTRKSPKPKESFIVRSTDLRISQKQNPIDKDTDPHDPHYLRAKCQRPPFFFNSLHLWPWPCLMMLQAPLPPQLLSPSASLFFYPLTYMLMCVCISNPRPGEDLDQCCHRTWQATPGARDYQPARLQIISIHRERERNMRGEPTLTRRYSSQEVVKHRHWPRKREALTNSLQWFWHRKSSSV